jgi:Type II secretion system (T2SS), protein G
VRTTRSVEDGIPTRSVGTSEVEGRERQSRMKRPTLTWSKLVLAGGWMILLGFALASKLDQKHTYRVRSNATARKIQILHRGCYVYRQTLHRFPEPGEWQIQLMETDKAVFAGPGVVLFVDSWGRDIRYRVPGRHDANDFDLYSVGENGLDEDGAGDDIGNWDGSSPRYDGVWRHLREAYVK